MSEDQYLKCSCKQCGNHIAFPPASAGTVVTCPHCGQWTELIADQPETKGSPSKLLLLLAVVIGCVTVAAGAVGAFLLLRAHSKGVAIEPVSVPSEVVVTPTNLPPTNATPAKPAVAEKKEKSLDDLKPGKVHLEKAKVGNLVYAVGTITNASEFQRFGVKVELELYNQNGKKIATTTDYKDIIEPNHEWQFHAMVLDSKTTSAKVASVKED